MAPILSSKLYQNKYQLFKCIIPKHANLAAKNATKIFTIFCLSVSFSSNLTECICEECNFMRFCFFHLHHQHLHAVCYAFSRGSLFQSVTATENDNGAKIGKFFFCRMHSKTKICVTRSLRTQLLVSIAEIYTLEKTKSRFHKNITLDFHKWCFTKVRNLHSLSLFPKTVSSSFEQTILFNKDC